MSHQGPVGAGELEECRRSKRSWASIALGAVLGLVVVGALLPAAASAAECTDTWKGPAEGVWSAAASWSAGHKPGASDVACIGAGKSVAIFEGVNQVAAVQGEGTVSLSGGSTATLELLSGVSEIKHFYESWGVLKGPGTLKVSSLLWSGGTMLGSGSTVVAEGGTGEISSGGASQPTLTGRSLVNNGIFTVVRNVRLGLTEGAEIQNNGTFILNSEWESGVASQGGLAPLFVNDGALKKTEGTGTSSVQVAVQNNGRIEAETGTLAFSGGGSSSFTGAAEWVAARGAAVAFIAGDFSSLKGRWSGSIQISGGTVTCEGTSASAASVAVSGKGTLMIQNGITVASLSQSGGILTGSGNLDVSETLNWAGGHMEGAGSTVLEPAGTGTISGAASTQLIGRSFVNRGTITLPHGSNRLETKSGSEIRNLGTFIANSEYEPAIAAEGTPPPTFVNEGTLKKTEGAGKTEIAPRFSNYGVLAPGVGTLAIPNRVSVSASNKTPHQSCAGDPVNCATGNFTETQTDLEIGGRGVGLGLTRSYSAQAAAAGSLGIFGYGWTNSFGDRLASEEGGAKETLTEASGGTVNFTQSGASWIAPSWSQDVLTGSAEAGFALTLSDQTIEHFSGVGRLESVIDRNGNETTLAYNGSGKLETITDPSGRKITLTYNAEGLVESAKDPMGHEVKYGYESKCLKSVTLPGATSASWQFKYDAFHRMTSTTDGRGGKTTNEYDSSSRVVAQTDPASRKTTLVYGSFHTTITNKATGAVTDEWFNSNNQPTSITRGFGTNLATTESFTYTAAGLLASKTDGNGHTTSYGYDAEGNRTSERDAEGDETIRTYNEAHELTGETKPNGEKTTIVRKADGNPETVSRPAPGKETQTVAYTYGPHGEVESMTNPLGHVWSYEYDSNGDLTAEIDPEGDKRSWVFDEDSRVISTTSPRGNEAGAEPAKFTTTIERDAQGRPVKITDPLGGATKRAYDADGNVESITDPNGRKTKFTYDADNERTKVELPNGTVEETGYDGAGQVTSQVDGNKNKTTYVRNVLGQPVEIIDPLERKTTQTFEAAGNLLTKTDPDGGTTAFGYDKANRLTGISYSAEPAQDATFAYNEDGALTSMKDATGESTWEYDQLGRLTHSEDGNGETVGWEYNLGNEPVGLTYPNGKSISRAYDKAGRLESVTDWLGHTTTFGYNADSDPTATTFPTATGDKDEYAWDQADRMSAVTMRKGAETLASLAYTRDPAGQLESLISKGLPGAETESFSYDEDERLTKAGVAEFGYDAANNVTKAPGTTNAFDKASQIESATGATFSFDKEGERTKETPSGGPATTYKYDQAGSLTGIERAEEAETPAIAESFGYDGLGLLASRTVGLTTSHLVWDLTESPEPLLSDGADSYIYGPGGLAVEEISSGEEPTYLHHDQLGSTRLLTNASGEVSGTFTYGPYGGSTGHTGTATTALGYAGQYTLGQSGLLYLRARYYDPATAQFLTLDPAVEVTGEPYGYAGDNPLRFKDPSGLWFAEELGEVGIPCVFCEAAQGVQELLEPSYEDAVAGGNWILNQLGTEELDEGDSAAEEVPCGEETRAERGTRRETREEEETFRAKEEHLRSNNPGNPNWLPSGPRSQAVAALIIKLLTQFFHGQG